MKKLIFVFTVCVAGLVLLDNCKREKTPEKQTQNNESDTAYIGRRYYFTVPDSFPNLSPAAASDTGTMTYEGIQLGRMLFYDKHISLDGHKSCASCHQQQYAFSDGGKALSTNEFGFTPRNAPSIENLAFAPYMFWDGREPTLATQAANAAQHELGLIAVNFIAYLQTDSTYVRLFKKAFGRPGTITEQNIYNAIQEFEITLISNNSQFDQYQAHKTTITTSAQFGYDSLFVTETGDCFHCHVPSNGLYTDFLFRNNGLDSSSTYYGFPDLGRGAITGNETQNGTFKDPSLRNIALTGPYMRNGRLQTLSEVINFYSDSTKISPTLDVLMLLPNHHYGAGLFLTPIQKQELLDFLNTLTDTSFITNPNFSDPFKH